VQGALHTLEQWTAERGFELVQVQSGGGQFQVAPSGEAGTCDLIVAIGGDGTVLAALHAAARTHTPVLGVACGSLGALSMVSAGGLRAGLDRIAAGDWRPRQLPALGVDTADGRIASAVNDVVLVRRGGTQLIVAVSLGTELYARVAGDGVVVATPLGSSAYSMAAGGPLLADGSDAIVCTPLAMHGGCVPPLVVPAGSELMLQVDPGHGGFDLEVDGHQVAPGAARFAVSVQQGYATLVDLGDAAGALSALRRRGLVADSPRVLARDERAARQELQAAPDAQTAPG
jgi:NAD+ kinase